MAEQSKLLRIVKNPRVIILMAAVVLAFVALSPDPWREGLEVTSVDSGSLGEAYGISSGANIVSVNKVPVRSVGDFNDQTESSNDSVLIETGEKFYNIKLNGSDTALGINVRKASKTRLKTGIDLQGGTRVLLKPDTRLSQTDMGLLIANMDKRLNLFGLSDVTIREVSDFDGQQFVMVEMASLNQKEIKDLISKQGRFEAKIGNESIFEGTDVRSVCRSSQCSGIDVYAGGCQPSGSEWVCPHYFTITLNREGAEKQAEVTKSIPAVQGYLSEPLSLYLDDELVEELQISESLKGVPESTIQISGSASGGDKSSASENAIAEMRQLQTILISGSLPAKLEIVKTDTVSPVLGEEFSRNALITGFVAIVAVMVLLMVVYRKFIISIPIMITSLLELFLLLGVAAAIGWSIDLAGIAGIIAAIGTGVNDQIIITEEAFKGSARKLRSWKDKLKSAFSVILGAYFTLLFAMIPLFIIGAGLLRGFAATTIIGITVGVLVTRPVYAKIIEILTE